MYSVMIFKLTIVAVSDSECLKIGVMLLQLFSCLCGSEVTLDLIEPRIVTRAHSIQSPNL